MQNQVTPIASALDSLRRRAPWALLAAVLLTGCGAPNEEEAGAVPHAIENGQLRPSLLNPGTVRIRIRDASGQGRWTCSGQVISRDTILTAAHCISNRGYYDNGWSEEVTVSIEVDHENHDVSNPLTAWDDLTPGEVDATAFVMEEYLDAAPGYEKGYDIALLRTQALLENTESTDVAAIARYKSQRPDWLWVYGHGVDSDDGGVPELRRGYFTDLTWNNASSGSFSRTVRSDYGDSDSHTCRGDSGGPWKTVSTNNSPGGGVIFAVHSSGYGDGLCAEEYSLGARTAYHDGWIEDVVEDGQGSCVRTTHMIFPHTQDFTVMSVNTLDCW